MNLQGTSRGRILLVAFPGVPVIFLRLAAIQVRPRGFEARAEQNQEGRVLCRPAAATFSIARAGSWRAT
jgi:hypothetical protein